MMFYNRQSKIVNRKSSFGSVLIEFTMAAAGLIAIAFVVTRVGVWLNRSMQARNANYQAQRVQAGSIEPGAGPTRFDAPGGIHLIGGTAGSTGGLPPQAASTYDTSCSNASLTQAAQKRADVLTALGITVPILQWSVGEMYTHAYRLLVQANELARDASTVADILRAIDEWIDPELDRIHNLPVVQGTQDHVIDLRAEFLQTDCSGFGGFTDLNSNPQVYGGLHNIDERWASIRCQLNRFREHSVAWTIWQLERLALIGIQLDPNWPGSTAWHLDPTKVGSTAWHLDPANTGSTAQLLEQAREACTSGTVLTAGPWDVTTCPNVVDPLHPAELPHQGTDFGATPGTVVQPFLSGTVREIHTGEANCYDGPDPLNPDAYDPIADRADCGNTFGNYVIVDHPDGTWTRYAHLDSVNVTAGRLVDGTVALGTVGDTGFSAGAHLHFELWETGNPTPLDPFASSGGCAVGTSTSAGLGDASTGTCDPGERSRLEGLLATYETNLGRYETDLADYQALKSEIETAVAPFTVADLEDLRNNVRADLMAEQDELAPLVTAVRDLQRSKEQLLNDVDRLLGNPHTSMMGDSENWMSLWASLAAQHGLDPTLAPDLSSMYRWIVTAWDNENRADRAEPSMMSAELEELIRRLWWLIRQRLDLAQSEQGPPDGTGFDGSVDDRFGEHGWYDEYGVYHDGDPDFSIPDRLTGVTPTPAGPARYPELVRLVRLLQEQGNLIRENIIDAEGLEHLGQTECASQEDN